MNRFGSPRDKTDIRTANGLDNDTAKCLLSGEKCRFCGWRCASCVSRVLTSLLTRLARAASPQREDGPVPSLERAANRPTARQRCISRHHSKRRFFVSQCWTQAKIGPQTHSKRRPQQNPQERACPVISRVRKAEHEKGARRLTRLAAAVSTDRLAAVTHFFHEKSWRHAPAPVHLSCNKLNEVRS